MSYKIRLRKVEVALRGSGKCSCRDIPVVFWCERSNTPEQFDAAMEKTRGREPCPVHRKPPITVVVRITRGLQVSK